MSLFFKVDFFLFSSFEEDILFFFSWVSSKWGLLFELGSSNLFDETKPRIGIFGKFFLYSGAGDEFYVTFGTYILDFVDNPNWFHFY